jgi:hypothetical protein
MSDIKRASRSGDYIRWRLRVADAYRRAGMPDDAKNFEDCSDPAKFFLLRMGDEMPAGAINAVVCSDDPAHLSKAICPSCQLRTCPDCAHRDSARLLARYMPTMQQYFDKPHRPEWKYRKVVFTSGISVRDADIDQQIERLYDALRKVFEKALRLLNSGPVAISDVGLLISHEFGPNGLKLHFHGIYYGPFIPQLLLSHLWRLATGWRIVSIERIGKSSRVGDLDDAVSEVVKYTTKFWKREKSGKVVFVDPEIVPILHKVLQGTRRIRSWGLFYDIQEPEEKACCPDCGAPLALLSKSEWDAWSQTGWKPDELRTVLRGDLLLNLIHGNKSPPHPPPIEHKQGILL